MRFSLPQYLTRINALSCLSAPPTLETLTTVMASHMCSISFENMDVVQNKAISITPEAVFDKLVAQGRGGYCFETNTLLQCALLELGFAVSPVLCRVRWGKALTQETGFTHLILKATDADGKTFLADVGFAGTNSIAPVSLDVGDTPQHLPEGTFRYTHAYIYICLCLLI
jgi:N-hydroxyarylamine O-acetyltransferase